LFFLSVFFEKKIKEKDVVSQQNYFSEKYLLGFLVFLLG